MMQYTHKKGLILCEGRGPYRRQAATRYHNRTARTMAIEGNTEIGLPLDPYVEMFSHAWGWIKDEHGLVNLGTVRPSRGGVLFGHRDFYATACPGDGMMAVIDQITLNRYSALEEDDMTFIGVGHDKAKTGGQFQSFRLYVTAEGLRRDKIATKEERDALAAAGYPLTKLTKAQLEQYAL